MLFPHLQYLEGTEEAYFFLSHVPTLCSQLTEAAERLSSTGLRSSLLMCAQPRPLLARQDLVNPAQIGITSATRALLHPAGSQGRAAPKRPPGAAGTSLPSKQTSSRNCSPAFCSSFLQETAASLGDFVSSQDAFMQPLFVCTDLCCRWLCDLCKQQGSTTDERSGVLRCSGKETALCWRGLHQKG